jgi:hypothetical protein
MKIFTGFMVVAFAVLFVNILLAPKAAPRAPVDPRPYEEANRKAYAASAKHVEAEKYAATTRTLVTAMLKDPASGRFGIVFHGRGKSVCGTINARNGFGGMTGQKAFVRVGNALPMFEDSWNESFVTAWNKYCAGAA